MPQPRLCYPMSEFYCTVRSRLCDTCFHFGCQVFLPNQQRLPSPRTVNIQLLSFHLASHLLLVGRLLLLLGWSLLPPCLFVISPPPPLYTNIQESRVSARHASSKIREGGGGGREKGGVPHPAIIITVGSDQSI